MKRISLFIIFAFLVIGIQHKSWSQPFWLTDTNVNAIKTTAVTYFANQRALYGDSMLSADKVVIIK